MTLATTPSWLARTLRAALVLFLTAGTAQAQWVNELHYDNDGSDEGEAVEVVLPSTADPAAYDLYLYNGNGGSVYGDSPYNLSAFTAGATESGYTVYASTIAGIQNGGPDGLALTENGAVVPGQFLSYEGTFMAVGGPADGLTSTDIGVAEGSGTSVGQSLQLTGTGTVYEDFTWAGPSAASFGVVNAEQAFGGPSPTPVVSFTESGSTATEGDVVTLTVQLDFPNDTPDGNPVTVDVVFDGEASTASPADFDGPAPAQLTFDGATDGEQQSVTVSVISGDGDEGGETAVFDLVVASGNVDLGTPSAFTLAIEDSEAPAPARVQLIHNAADPFAELVDVSIVPVDGGGEGTSFNDVPFRGATPFFDLAPGTYQVVVTDEEDLAVVLIDEEVSVASGESYQLIANGVADPSAFEPNPSGQPIGAELFVNAGALESINDGQIATIALNVVHGTTDAPAIDLALADGGDLSVVFDDLVYGDVSVYDTLGVDLVPQLDLVVTTADGSVEVGRFAFRTPEDDTALTVLASGFLTPENDQDGPPFGLLAVFADGTTTLLPRIVDLAGARDLPLGTPVQVEGVVTRALGDFTRFQDETGGLTVRQPEGPFSEDVADGTIAPGTALRVTGTTSEFRQLLQINGDDLESYEVLGTVAPPEPQPVTLEEIAADGEEYESELIEVINLIIDPDGDAVFQPATTYGVTDPSLGDGSVALRTPNAEDTEIDGEPIPMGLATFTGVLGQFDFDDPTAGYQLLPVQADDVTAQEAVNVPLQIIHNAPDPAFAEVDVYVDGTLAFDDFAFRTATEFGELPADVPIEVAIAPGDSEGVEDAVFTETYTLSSDATAYQLIALGVGEGDFEPNPDGEDIAFTLLLNDEARLFSETDDTLSDLNFVHGTPDAPTIDVRIGATQDVILYNDVTYGGIAGYQPLAPEEEVLEVSSADGSTTFATFFVDLADRIDEAGTILASGFFTPENEPGDAPDFGLLVVFADGTAQFVEPGLLPNTEDGVAPAAFALDGNYPNPFAGRTTLRYDLPADARVHVAVFDVLGRQVLDVTQEAVAAGTGRTVTLDTALPSGAYVYRLTAEMPGETATATGRMTVVR